jgi:hypothetical protein
VKYVDGD